MKEFRGEFRRDPDSVENPENDPICPACRGTGNNPAVESHRDPEENGNCGHCGGFGTMAPVREIFRDLENDYPEVFLNLGNPGNPSKLAK